jgi:hypothetical protein
LRAHVLTCVKRGHTCLGKIEASVTSLEEEVTMSAKAAARRGAARRSGRRKAVAAPRRIRAEVPPEAAEVEEWNEAEEDSNRLDEGEMEILLTGHAATHGSEEEDNWLIKTEEESWGEER